MKECPNCGYTEIPCEVKGCNQPAVWEGWHRVRDFAGIPTGLIQKRVVCDTHKHLLGVEELAPSK